MDIIQAQEGLTIDDDGGKPPVAMDNAARKPDCVPASSDVGIMTQCRSEGQRGPFQRPRSSADTHQPFKFHAARRCALDLTGNWKGQAGRKSSAQSQQSLHVAMSGKDMHHALSKRLGTLTVVPPRSGFEPPEPSNVRNSNNNAEFGQQQAHDATYKSRPPHAESNILPNPLLRGFAKAAKAPTAIDTQQGTTALHITDTGEQDSILSELAASTKPADENPQSSVNLTSECGSGLMMDRPRSGSPIIAVQTADVAVSESRRDGAMNTRDESIQSSGNIRPDSGGNSKGYSPATANVTETPATTSLMPVAGNSAHDPAQQGVNLTGNLGAHGSAPVSTLPASLLALSAGNESQSAVTQRSPPVRNQEGHDKILKAVSSRGGPVKVSRRGSGPTMVQPVKNDAVATSLTSQRAPSSAQILEILTWTLQQENARAINAVEVQRDLLGQDVSTLTDANHSLNTQLTSVRNENHQLSQKLRRLAAHLARYDTEVRGLKELLAGLGNELKTCRIHMERLQDERSNLSLERDNIRTSREELGKLFSRCLTTSSQNLLDIRTTCAEFSSHAQALEQSKDFLEAQLNEKVGLLAEERDRRVGLEKQNESSRTMQEDLKQVVEQHGNWVAQSLRDLQTLFSQTGFNETSQAKLDECNRLARELQTTSSGIPDTLNDLTHMLRTVSDRYDAPYRKAHCYANGSSMSSQFETLTNISLESQSTAGMIGSKLEDGIRVLKAEIIPLEDMHNQMAALREANASLQQLVVAKDGSLSVLKEENDTLRIANNSAFQRISELDSEILELRSARSVDQLRIATSQEAAQQLTVTLRELEDCRRTVTEAMNKNKILEANEANARLQLMNLQVCMHPNFCPTCCY